MSNAVKPTGAVHPVAGLFPLLGEEDLREMAAGIAEHGLLEPLVIDSEGTLIDGRNRKAACEIAGVEPTYETLNGTDPVAYIIEANIKRRHLSVGQRALLVAQAARAKVSVTDNQARETMLSLAQAHDLKQPRLTEAFTILDYAPELVPGIMAGTQFLTAAHTIALQRKEEQSSSEERAKRDAADLHRLRTDAPDLADLVAEWSLSLSEAMQLLTKREQDLRDRCRRETVYFDNNVSMLWTLLHPDPTSIVTQWVDGVAQTMQTDHLTHLRTGSGLRQLADLILGCADAVDARGGLS